MDKFDESIKNAHEAHEPSAHFVEDTMTQITNEKPELKKARGRRFWAPIGVGAVAVVLVFTLVLHGKNNNLNGANGTVATNNQTTSSNGGTSAQQGAANGSAASGTDNASLASDLSGVQSSMNQENGDQNSANNTLNDQQQEIAVPTD